MADLTEGWLTDHSVSVNCNANDREGRHQDCQTGEHLYHPLERVGLGLKSDVLLETFWQKHSTTIHTN